MLCCRKGGTLMRTFNKDFSAMQHSALCLASATFTVNID